MSSTGQELHELLGLRSNVVETISYRDFLVRLTETPEVADSAAATLVRAIESKGEVDIDISPQELRPYLKMLKKMGIPTWNAFKDVRGSQRVVARLLNHLRAAAANGYQQRLAILLKGGPGSGKSFLANAFKEALEGEVVYAVDGCPVHENPINLLNLLPVERIAQIERQLKMTAADRDAEYKQAVRAAKGNPDAKPARKPTLQDLLAISGQPCQHCWEKVMQDKESPNLAEVKVTAMRLSSRSFGIATWGRNCTLAQSLEMGSRGVVDMPELFGSAASTKDAGVAASVEELDILLEATNDRQIPAGCGDDNSCNDRSARKGFLPLDAVMIGQTNDGSYARFMKEQADPDKFLRRLAIFNVPYITSVSEEEQAYRTAIAEMRQQPHFDPMTLKITALLAVISRMKKDHAEVDIVKRARMYDGEQLAVEKRNINAGAQNAQSSNPFGTTANYGGRSTTSTQPVKKAIAYWSVGEFWAEAGEDEGMAGLNMPEMLNIISEAVSLVMKDAGPDNAPCISTLEMLGFLRAKIAQMKKKPGLTDSQKQVLENCTEYLRPPKGMDDKPGLIEEEYRRVLKRQFLEVIAPDFERRASALFERYRIHAIASAKGLKETVEMVEQGGKLVERRVKVNFDGILDDLEKHMGLTSLGDKEDFRKSVEGHILQLTINASKSAEDEESDEDAVKAREVTWRTLPKLAEGIAKKLNDDAATKLERVLKSEIELSEEDKVIRRDALQRFKELGYCEHCAKVALTYFNDYQLWKQS
ncbi:MAG: hypothetical protein LCH63_15495 [Candidatus Melainabacteria bacterium]|nr:hypothetical protein [Candidatus Melainabacteria bacterium]